MGAHYSTSGSTGHAYVVFGHAGAFQANIGVATFDGTNGGFHIIGEASYDSIGWEVASAGDMNGDGFEDIVISGWFADRGGGGTTTGAAYVVFGKAGGFGTINLGDLNGTTGFELVGQQAQSRFGWAVSGAGDVNNDGFDDIIVGAPYADSPAIDTGAAYVVYGRGSGFAATLGLAGLNGSNGFRLEGFGFSLAGMDVASADFDGDGYSDLIVGAPMNQQVHVIYGSGAMPASQAMSGMFGRQTMHIYGEWALGNIVGGGGDFNGDGFDDLLYAVTAANGGAGAVYVVYGGARLTGYQEQSSFIGTRGVRIDGPEAAVGFGLEIAFAGDLNGDGADEVMISARNADGSAGRVYIIWGDAPPVPLTIVGDETSETITGDELNDTLSGMGGNDILNGLAGDDLLDGGDMADLLNGGDGADDLVGGGGGDTLNGDAGDDQLDGGDGADKLFGGAGADLMAGAAGNDRMSGEDDIDTLNGGAGNDYLDGGTGADVMSGGTDNDVYIVDNAGDQTIELADEGYDIVRTNLSWALADNLECLQLQGTGDVNGTGNAGANNLQGNAGNNTLSGLGGTDTINGGDGDDTIIGGEGNDLLRGGTGADTFLVAHAFGPSLETDQIYDFTTADGDLIDLSGVDADTGAAGDQGFVLVETFTATAGEMTLSFAGGITTLRLDVDGDGRVDYQMKINGDVTGDSAGWIF